MAMKRRGFLAMLGGTVSAPLMPVPALGKAATVGAGTISQSAVQAAIVHAKSRAVFSVWGLATATNLTVEQATAVMEHLAERGILGPLQGTTHGGRWTTSKVWQSEMLAEAKAARALRQSHLQAKHASRRVDVNLHHFIEHLRTLAARYESRKPVLATT